MTKQLAPKGIVDWIHDMTGHLVQAKLGKFALGNVNMKARC